MTKYLPRLLGALAAAAFTVLLASCPQPISAPALAEATINVSWASGDSVLFANPSGDAAVAWTPPSTSATLDQSYGDYTLDFYYITSGTLEILTGVLTSGSTAVTLSSDLAAGTWYVIGDGIPSGATATASGTTSVTLSAAATLSDTVGLAFFSTSPTEVTPTFDLAANETVNYTIP